jgi:uncharacterized membrane protein
LLLAVSTAGFLATARPAISPSEMTEIAIYTLAIVGGILLPALLAANFSKQESKRFTNFLVFLLASVILTIIPAIFANINNHENYLWLFIWNPPIFITMADESSFDKNQLLTAVMIVDFIILALLLATAAIAFRGYREIIKEAESGLAVPAP